EDTSSVKSMMAEMYNAFRSQSSSAPSSSVTLTFALTETSTNVEGENATHTATKEPSSHTEGETDANIHDKPEEPKQSTNANIFIYLQSLRHNPSQSFILNLLYHKERAKALELMTRRRIKENWLKPQYWDKEKEIKKAEEDARLNAISKIEVIKVVREEAKKLVARMESIRIFLAFATYMNFKVYQMDVKSSFLNSKLKEEVYVKQPPGFESSEFPDYVCKLDKALYELKQAPKA
nr:retrovirus-related Pol polyprotein from transposon TNT 1-94 [Tanacetum cinerariifolium]